ncbi:family 20 glycosylhydrolase [Pedobacter sp. UC225_65]|uniref:family 20 glycosylhydrolase n=1 Tax=Pedobacter sp. UC225_65 TaxID=3350173 RepID=UPI00366D6F94
MKTIVKLIFVVALCPLLAYAQNDKLAIIPKPEKLTVGVGSFNWNFSTQIILKTGDKDFEPALNELKSISASLKTSIQTPNSVTLIQDPSISAMEGYQLIVKPNAITIKVAQVQAAFWAIATLKQLMGHTFFKNGQKTIAVPCVTITDQPKFAWRGVHLDVSRHFFDLAYLRTMIDRMAYYKFNKFHLHLTDDQGWRIEIKKYPELTAKGAWRTMNAQDSSCIALSKTNPDYAIPEKHFKVIDGKRMYGGFYTQEEMKGLIGYALNKGIEIIPEIDMPGHMMAATNLMPWLTAKGKGGQAKDFSEPLCPCKETTFEFAENVFAEIAALFPSRYIHLGADEVEKSSWKNVPECEALMKKEGLKNIDELQSYFVHRMEKFFNSKGKKLIGWDEILDGGLSSTATMMYWRSWVPEAPKMAAEKGNQVIMTPGEYCYFDALQDAGTLKKVYGFNPFNYNLTAEERKYIIGVQANIWTEYIPSERKLEYMVFPRLLALAEVAWSGNQSNWSGFEQRLKAHYQLLDLMQVNYRMPDIEGFAAQSVFVDKAVLQVKKPYRELTLRYTTDGTWPTPTSSVLPTSLTITKPMQLNMAAFTGRGTRGDVYTVNYKKSTYLKALDVSNLKKGLKFYYYPKFYKSVTLINTKDLAKEAITNAIEIPVENKAGSFATKHMGYFYAKETGVYTFALRSDDGSVLKIANQQLIDNDGMHSSKEMVAQIALQKGYHPFELLFIEGGGGYTLKLQYQTPKGTLKDIDANVLFH